MRAFSLFVPGHAKTKGSVESLGNGRVRQSVEGSARWAQLVRGAVETHMQRLGIETVPSGNPVSVHLRYWLDCEDVTAGGVGDVDKLERNILDALTKAGLYADDRQVVRVVHEKWPARPDRNAPAGVLIQVFEGYV